MARPTKLTDETIDKLCRAIRMGMTIEEAAQLAGIHKTTYYYWKKKGRVARSGEFFDFFNALKRAEVEARAILLKRIHDASSGNQVIIETRELVRADGRVDKITITRQIPPQWQASAWILERRWPAEFGRNRQPAEDKHSSMDEVIVILENARVEAGVYDKPVDPSPRKEAE